MFSILAGDPGIFPVITDPSATDSVSYNLDSGEISFSVGVLSTGVYTDPVFCFDAANGGSSAVKLRIYDANGHVVAENFGLSSSLQYLLGFNEITVAPPSTAQCFYRKGGAQGTFGLFGNVFDPGPQLDPILDGPIFGDEFASFPELSIEYENIASSVNLNSQLQYNLVIRNTGNVPANNLSFQEVFPANGNVYDAILTDGNWSCVQDTWCPNGTSASGTGPLRITGLTLPAGATMTYQVTRQVQGNALLAETIDLHAGVISGIGGLARFDVAEKTIAVLGDPVALEFAAQPPSVVILGAPIDSDIMIDVVDDRGNRVTTDNDTEVQIRLLDSNGNEVGSNRLVNWTVVNEGRLVLENLTIDEADPGIGFQLRASADNVAFGYNISSASSNAFEVTIP